MSRVQTLEVIDIPVERIIPSPYQPRIDFDLEELRGSIIKYGIIDPLKVRKVGDSWELVDGERRWRIAKQEGIKSVPCIVSEYSDEDADALAWRFNTERKEYSLEERAKHFRKHQEEGMSGAAIGRIHGYSRQQVNKLLAIFRLPEKYQIYLWTGEFALAKYQYLYLKGIMNDSGNMLPEVIKIIDESVERRMIQREFENVVDGYLSDLEKRQVEEAGKVATQLEASKNREEKAREALGEPEVKEPETSEEFEEAAKALMEEAKRRKSPEQILEEKLEKVKGSLLTGKGNIVSRIEKAKELGIDTEWMEEEVEKIKNKMSFSPDGALLDSKVLKKQVNELIKRFQEGQKEAELREKLMREAREKAEEDLLKDEDFLKKAAELAPIDESPPVKEAPLIASMPEEFEAVRERLNETQEWIRATLERPEVIKRGKLFRNWLAHTTLHEAAHSASCPECGADWTKLRWECHNFDIEESFEKARDAYQESMKGEKT